MYYGLFLENQSNIKSRSKHMKKNIAIIVLISLFSSLTIMAVPAFNENESDVVNESISRLKNIQTELQSSPVTRRISRLINSAIKIFTRATSNPNPSCPRRIEISLLKLDRAIDRLAKKEKMAGATAIKGFMGFGCKSHMHTAKLLRLSEDLPIIIEIVDSPEKINKFIEMLDSMVKEGLITLEKANVIMYRANS